MIQNSEVHVCVVSPRLGLDRSPVHLLGLREPPRLAQGMAQLKEGIAILRRVRRKFHGLGERWNGSFWSLGEEELFPKL